MDWYRHICAHFVTPLWAKWEKSDYLNHIEYIKKLQFIPNEEIKDLQWQKVKVLLDHAYNNCSYYNQLFHELQLHPSDILSWSDFEKIPLLTKQGPKNNCSFVAMTFKEYEF